MCADAKGELIRIYSELRTLEKDRIEKVGNELYNKALDKFRKIHSKALGEPSPSLEYPRYDPQIVRQDILETRDQVQAILRTEDGTEVKGENAQEEIREILEETNKSRNEEPVEQPKTEWKEAEVKIDESPAQEKEEEAANAEENENKGENNEEGAENNENNENEEKNEFE